MMADTPSSSESDILSSHPFYTDYGDAKPDPDEAAYLEELHRKEAELPQGYIDPDLRFPLRLHRLLHVAEVSEIISWQPHGRCFKVHNPSQFLSDILPTYFRQSKLASFNRQLNIYGFRRISRGRDRGGYFHPCFLRQKEFLCFRIQRTEKKGKGKGRHHRPIEEEPDFYKIKFMEPYDASGSDSSPFAKDFVAKAAKDKVRRSLDAILSNQPAQPTQVKNGGRHRNDLFDKTFTDSFMADATSFPVAALTKTSNSPQNQTKMTHVTHQQEPAPEEPRSTLQLQWPPSAADKVQAPTNIVVSISANSTSLSSLIDLMECSQSQLMQYRAEPQRAEELIASAMGANGAQDQKPSSKPAQSNLSLSNNTGLVDQLELPFSIPPAARQQLTPRTAPPAENSAQPQQDDFEDLFWLQPRPILEPCMQLPMEADFDTTSLYVDSSSCWGPDPQHMDDLPALESSLQGGMINKFMDNARSLNTCTSTSYSLETGQHDSDEDFDDASSWHYELKFMTWL